MDLQERLRKFLSGANRTVKQAAPQVQSFGSNLLSSFNQPRTAVPTQTKPIEWRPIAQKVAPRIGQALQRSIPALNLIEKAPWDNPISPLLRGDISGARQSLARSNQRTNERVLNDPLSVAMDFGPTGVAGTVGKATKPLIRSGQKKLAQLMDISDAQKVQYLSAKMQEMGNISIPETDEVFKLAEKLRIPRQALKGKTADKVLSELGSLVTPQQAKVFRQPTFGFDIPNLKNAELDRKLDGFNIPKLGTKGSTEMFGGVAGIEVDEEGNVDFDPAKAAIGIAGIGSVNAARSKMGGLKQPRTVEQGLNTAKFALSKTQQKTVKALQEKLGLGTRNVRSFEDMRALADDLGTQPQRLLKDIENGRITDKEVIALGDVISTSTKRITSLTRKLKANPSDDAVRAGLQAEEEFLNNALSKRIKGGTEAGRAVAAFRVIANRTMDRAYWLDKAKRQIGEEKQIPAEVADAINGYIKSNDRLGLAQFVAQLGESTGWEKSVSLWKAGLLTGFRTHEANILSNVAFGAIETAKDLPATAFDVARSAVTGTPREKTISLSQVTKQIPAAFRGAKEGVEYMKSGYDPRDLNKSEIFKPLRFGDSKAGRAAQAYTNTIFRGLGAGDRVFFRTNFERSMAEQMKLARINQKLSPAQVKTLRENPTPEMLTRAEMDARYATFTKDNALADAIRGAKRSTSPAVRAGIDVVAPFTRTPTNVAEALMDYSPAGFVKDLVKGIVKRGSVDEKRLAESFGRSVTGTGIAWMGYELAKNGLITGASPPSAAERAQNDLEGEMSGSILVDGQWRALSRLSPVGNLLILGSEAHRNELDPVKTAFSTAKAVTDQTFLKGLSRGLKAISEPDRFGPSFTESTIAGVIPTLSSDIARGLDDTQRLPDGVGQRIMARLPGLRERVPAKLDQFGEPMKQEGGFLGNVLDPFNSRTPNSDPVVQELKRVGYNLNYVGDSIGDEELTQPQKQEYQRRAGEYTQALLPGVLSSSSYQAVDSDTQKSIIERVVNRAKDLARDELKAQGLDTVTSTSGQVDASMPETDKDKPFVFFDADKNEVRVIEMDFNVKAPELTGNEELDKKLISDYKSSITRKVNDIVDLYQQEQITAEQAEAMIASLEAQRDATGGGSGKKGKKLSMSDLPTIKTPKREKITYKQPTRRRTSNFQLKQVEAPNLEPLRFK